MKPWQVAFAAGAGTIVSYLILIACLFAVRRFGPGSLSEWTARFESCAFDYPA